MPDPAREDDAWTDRNRRLAELLARVALHDQAAFGRLYQRTSAHLFGVILRIHRDRALAEDVLQEAYVNVWRAAGHFDASRSAPLTWLTSIARNRAIDRLRREQAQPLRPGLEPVDPDDGEPIEHRLPDEGAGPLALLGRAVEARALEDCVASLSAPQRQSVALAFYDGLSHAEVAEHLREPLGTVKSWVRRALQALKACLQRAADRDATEG